MRRLSSLIVAVVAVLGLAPCASAVNIAWVTPHSPSTSTAASGLGFVDPPDKGYTDLLTGAGHTVTRFLTPPNGNDVALDSTQLATLNAADLVIIGRASNSGAFDNVNEINSWNTQVTKPLILTSGYIARNNRLGFTTGTTIPDITGSTRLLATVPANPLFQGVTLNGSNETGEILFLATSPFAGPARGASINTNAIVSGGTALARITSDNAVAGVVNAALIAEFPAGTASSFAGGGNFAARRMLFETGSREAASGSNSDAAGIIDLSPAGQQLFLNAVTYMTTTFILGDTNGNGTGGEYPADFNPIRDNFRKSPRARSEGDLTFDGVVDFDDFRQWKAAAVGSGASLEGLDLSFLGSVPEPGSILLLLVASMSFVMLRGERPTTLRDSCS